MSIATAHAEPMFIASDATEQAAFVAELLARAILDSIDRHAVARVALSGGTTPAEAYRRLARFDLPWSSIEWFWVDERAAPVQSDRSNYHNAARDLMLAPDRVHAMQADDPDLDAAARRYETLLRRTFGIAGAVAFDAVTLGVGEDGHVASLFPGMQSTLIDDRLVIPVPAQPDRGLEARLTLTAPVLLEARLLVVMARGAAKRGPVAAARSPGPEEEIPARVIRRAKGRVVWVLDRAAAGEA